MYQGLLATIITSVLLEFSFVSIFPIHIWPEAQLFATISSLLNMLLFNLQTHLAMLSLRLSLLWYVYEECNIFVIIYIIRIVLLRIVGFSWPWRTRDKYFCLRQPSIFVKLFTQPFYRLLNSLLISPFKSKLRNFISFLLLHSCLLLLNLLEVHCRFDAKIQCEHVCVFILFFYFLTLYFPCTNPLRNGFDYFLLSRFWVVIYGQNVWQGRQFFDCFLDKGDKVLDMYHWNSILTISIIWESLRFLESCLHEVRC